MSERFKQPRSESEFVARINNLRLRIQLHAEVYKASGIESGIAFEGPGGAIEFFEAGKSPVNNFDTLINGYWEKINLHKDALKKRPLSIVHIENVRKIIEFAHIRLDDLEFQMDGMMKKAAELIINPVDKTKAN